MYLYIYPLTHTQELGRGKVGEINEYSQRRSSISIIFGAPVSPQRLRPEFGAQLVLSSDSSLRLATNADREAEVTA